MRVIASKNQPRPRGLVDFLSRKAERQRGFIVSRYNELMEFEWDDDKAKRNLAKHDVSFPEASTVFEDPLSVAVSDPDHSFEEQRFIIVGASHRNRLLMVGYTERGEHIRIITARELTRRERETYEHGNYL